MTSTIKISALTALLLGLGAISSAEAANCKQIITLPGCHGDTCPSKVVCSLGAGDGQQSTLKMGSSKHWYDRYFRKRPHRYAR
jgi:hypothetical protein